MKYDFELIPVPTEALEAVGIIPGVMAEAFVDGKRIVIQKAEDDAFCKATTRIARIARTAVPAAANV